MKTLKNADKKNAQCNDGSPPIYFISTVTSSDKWLIYFKGGAGCYNNESCLDRYHHHFNLFSSKPYEDKGFHNANGIFSRNC